MADSTKVEDIQIKGIDFELTHVKLHVSSAQTHKIAYCAANRVVKEEPINGKINGLYGKITDENGTFIYGCYVRSKFLDANVRADRTDLTIDEVREGGDHFQAAFVGFYRTALPEATRAKPSSSLHRKEELRIFARSQFRAESIVFCESVRDFLEEIPVRTSDAIKP